MASLRCLLFWITVVPTLGLTPLLTPLPTALLAARVAQAQEATPTPCTCWCLSSDKPVATFCVAGQPCLSLCDQTPRPTVTPTTTPTLTATVPR